MTTKSIGELVLEVIALRQRVQEHQAILTKRRAEWTQANDLLIEHLGTSNERLVLAENTLREAGLGVYAATGNKHPYPGVEVKVLAGI